MKMKKGQAGLNLYLSVIATIFMIGLIVFVFAIAGGKLNTATRETTGNIAVSALATASGMTNDKNTSALAVAFTGLDSKLESCHLTPSVVYNATGGTSGTIPATNYTITGCKIYANPPLSAGWSVASWRVNGTYKYTQATSASSVINQTTNSLVGAIDWFSTFIVLGAMVVLILLIVIIINSIRNTGLINREGA